MAYKINNIPLLVYFWYYLKYTFIKQNKETKKMRRLALCDDCGKACRDIELNVKRGSNKMICDECVKKREKGKENNCNDSNRYL